MGSISLNVTQLASKQGKTWLAQYNSKGQRVIALNPGAGHPMKRWPMERFLQLARLLTKANFATLFIFGPKETDIYQSYAADIENEGSLVFRSDNFCIQPLAGILQHCALLVSNDCAVMHVGAAIGCPVVAIFGPSKSHIWFPYSRTQNRIIEHNMICRKNCHHGCKSMSCLMELTVKKLFKSVLSLSLKSL